MDSFLSAVYGYPLDLCDAHTMGQASIFKATFSLFIISNFSSKMDLRFVQLSQKIMAGKNLL